MGTNFDVFQVRRPKRLERWLRLILPSDLPMDSLYSVAGEKLRYHALEQTAYFNASKTDVLGVELLYFMLPIHTWPRLWLVRQIQKYFGEEVVSISVTGRDGQTCIYTKGLPSSDGLGFVVAGIQYDQFGCTIFYKGGREQFVPREQVDHDSIERM